MVDGNAAAAGAADTAAAGGAAGNVAAGGAAASASWTAELPPEHQTLVGHKQWAGPKDVVHAYANLEKMAGLPAEQLLRLPGDDKPESWAPIYDRLGRPKEAKEYGLPVPEGGDPKFAEAASAWFHEQGLSKKQALGLTEKWNAHVADVVKHQTEASQAKAVAEHGVLKTEWGAAFDQNVGAAKNAAKALGFDAKTIDALEQTMGFAGVMKLMHNLGTKLGEAKFVAGEKPAGFSGAMTPAQAQARITALKADSDFARRLTMGDAVAKAEWQRVHEMAAPPQS